MKLAYLVSRYPLITETFVLREMVELEKLGHRITVAPLHREKAAVVHDAALAFEGRTLYLPVISLAMMGANFRVMRRNPRLYFSTLWRAWHENWGDLTLFAAAVVYWLKIVTFAEAFERAGIEHVHAHFATHPALAAWIVHRLTGIPYSFTAHAHDIFVYRHMFARKTHDAEFVVTISEFNRKWIEQLCPDLNPEKLLVLHCGVPVERYAGLHREHAGDRDRPLRLLTVAALRPYKGHSVLLEACAVLKQHLPFTLRMVGGGPLRQHLEEQIANLQLRDCVTLVGPLEEEKVRDELAQADVFVLPSVREASGKMEGIPVALMEAMASGLPVIATHLSGIPELVIDGRSGLLVPEGDARAIAQAVTLLRDPSVRERMGTEGRKHVIREFNLSSSVRQLSERFQLRTVNSSLQAAS